MAGLLNTFVKAPEIQDKIVFSKEGFVEKVIEHTKIAHGVTGAVTYSPHGKHYLCIEATLDGPKRKIILADELPFPLKEIFEAKTHNIVLEVLETYGRTDNYVLE